MTTVSPHQHQIDKRILAALKAGQSLEQILRTVEDSRELDIREVAADHNLAVIVDAVDETVIDDRDDRRRAAERVQSVAEFVESNNLDLTDLLSQEMVAREWGTFDDETGHWSGPFFHSRSRVNREAIARELSEPGSVLGDDSRTPWQRRVAAQVEAEEALERETAATTQADDEAAAEAEQKRQDLTPDAIFQAIKRELAAGQIVVRTVVSTTPGATPELVRAVANEHGFRVFETVEQAMADGWKDPLDDPNIPQFQYSQDD